MDCEPTDKMDEFETESRSRQEAIERTGPIDEFKLKDATHVVTSVTEHEITFTVITRRMRCKAFWAKIAAAWRGR